MKIVSSPRRRLWMLPLGLFLLTTACHSELREARSLGNPEERSKALVRVAADLWIDAKQDQALEILVEALQAAEKIEYFEPRLKQSQQVVSKFLDFDHFDAAYSAVKGLEQGFVKGAILQVLSARIYQAGEHERAGRILDEAHLSAVLETDIAMRTSTLALISRAYRLQEARDKAMEAMVVAEQGLPLLQPFDNHYRASALAAVVRAYAELGEKERIEKILADAPMPARKPLQEQAEAIFAQMAEPADSGAEP